MFHYLLEGALAGGVDAPSMRLFISAGAIMPKALNERFEAAFNVPLLDGYGITETSTMVTMNWPTGGRPLGSCGLPLPGSTVRIVDAAGRDVPAGVDGEILVAGPHVMLGYYNQPDATARALDDGFYHTGDLGRRDENGYLTITGRIKELIIRGGENIYPAEVEEALAQHETVLDCAVAAKPDTALGEIVVAYVVLRAGHAFDREALAAFCRTRMTAFKVPAEFHPVEAIPRTGSGKIMRYKLQEAVAR
jgi:acyl-CoA synthetase (AMP-forming)/AMP-acid ligase II